MSEQAVGEADARAVLRVAWQRQGCTWEDVAPVLQDIVDHYASRARVDGAAEARRDAIARLEGFRVDPAVVEHFRSLLPEAGS